MKILFKRTGCKPFLIIRAMQYCRIYWKYNSVIRFNGVRSIIDNYEGEALQSVSNIYIVLYISMRISLVMCIWKFIVQGEAADYKVNISQGPRHCLYCPRRSQGQYRQCRGPRDIFFHEHCNQWDPHEYIVFILQMESPVNLCSENAVISYHSYWGSK